MDSSFKEEMKLSPAEVARCIAQFLSAPCYGPRWELPSLARKDGIVRLGPSRKNRFLTFNDKTQALYVWAAETGIHPQKIAQRIDRHGWTIERALTKGARK